MMMAILGLVDFEWGSASAGSDDETVQMGDGDDTLRAGCGGDNDNGVDGGTSAFLLAP
jgi:hypothetical protein